MADLAAGTRIAGYTVVRLVGRGGFGSVYVAQDRRLGRRVALKILDDPLSTDEQARARFINESRLAASLDHPNIVPIYEAGTAGGRPFLAMRYVPGPDLGGIVASEGRLEPVRLARMLEQVASALDAAHAAGLVHRDVKPGNVLVAPDTSGSEHVYLTDFGVSKRVGGTGLVSRSHAGSFVGTVGYVAPEQVKGLPVDARADVYSLGCLAYHCLAGNVPFARASDIETLIAHVEESPPSIEASLPGLGIHLDGVLSRAMAKDPAARHPSAGAFAGEFSRAIDATGLGRTIGATAVMPAAGSAEANTGTARNARPTIPRRSALAGAAAALLLLGGSAALFAIRPRGTDDAASSRSGEPGRSGSPIPSIDAVAQVSATPSSGITTLATGDTAPSPEVVLIVADPPAVAFEDLASVRESTQGAVVPLLFQWSSSSSDGASVYGLERAQTGTWEMVPGTVVRADPPIRSTLLRGVEHSLRIRPTDVASGQALSPSPPTTFLLGTYQEDNPTLRRSGTWSRPPAEAVFGKTIETTDDGATISFTATHADCYAVQGRGQGVLRISEQGGAPVRVDLGPVSPGADPVIVHATACDGEAPEMTRITLTFVGREAGDRFAFDGIVVMHRLT